MSNVHVLKVSVKVIWYIKSVNETRNAFKNHRVTEAINHLKCTANLIAGRCWNSDGRYGDRTTSSVSDDILGKV